MKVLYIGQYTHGTTSKMRADVLREELKPTSFMVIDTHVPFYDTSKFWRTIGFRYKIGALISKINAYVLEELKLYKTNFLDLIWVDKGVFLKTSTINALKKRSKKLVHFTPDMAFYANKSRFFEKSIPLYDFLITTKSSELAFYQMYANPSKIILTTQGFSKETHRSYYKFEEKENAVCFIGLAEPYRKKIAKLILENQINLKLVGKGWDGFVNKYKNHPNLCYLGDGVFGEEYSKLISSCKFGIGLLSKKFPELHTTRTFEIPACKTALITEQNVETLSYFNEDEVLFYSNIEELFEKLDYYNNNQNELKALIDKGNIRVMKASYDYNTILRKILNTVLTN